MKQLRTSALCLLLCLTLLCACTPTGKQQGPGTAETQSVTDLVGRTVEIPKEPACICALDPFCAPFVVAFGYGEQVKATIPSIQRDVLIQSICPSLKEAEVVKSGGPRPMLYQVCGTEDFLYQVNTEFRDHLKRIGYDAVFRDGPGSHSWAFWDAEIQHILKWLPISRKA